MPGAAHAGGMLTTLHPGAPSADEIAVLLAGIRQLDDALDTLTQVRIDLARLIHDTHWRSKAVEILRESLLERVADVSTCCASIGAQRDVCLGGIR